jgi:hypothetical protein
MASSSTAPNKRSIAAAKDAASPFAAALATSQDPSRWHCVQCGSTSNVWLSLYEGSAYCSCDSTEEDHVAAHCKTLKGPAEKKLYMRISLPQEIKNWQTGNVIKFGERKGDDPATTSAVVAIRSRLRQLQSLGGEKWKNAKGWDKLRLAVKLFSIPFLTRQSQIERERKDRQATALRNWAQLDLARAFRKWKDVAKEGVPQQSPSVVGQKRSRVAASLPAVSPMPSDAVPFFPLPKTQAEKLARTGLHTGLRNLGLVVLLWRGIAVLVPLRSDFNVFPVSFFSQQHVLLQQRPPVARSCPALPRVAILPASPITA